MRLQEASRTGPDLLLLGRRTKPVRRASRALARGLRPPPRSRSVPGYGRDPVGNGHAAAGFSAVLAPLVPAVDGGAAIAVAALPALGLAGFASAFFFFLAGFFFLPATLLVAFFLDDFFFF